MRSLHLFCVLALSVGCAGPVQTLRPFEPMLAAPADAAKLRALAPQLDALFQQRFAESKATGMAVGIVLDGELVYSHGFGLREQQSSQLVDGNTLFRMASNTKGFTGMAILKLRDEGKLALDEPISTYLPELSSLAPPTRDAPPITARALLTHSAGLSDDNMWGSVSFGFEAADLRALLHSGESFAHAPGAEFEYSNLGYALLGQVIERLSGMSYSEYVSTNILRPLGMHNSTWASRVAAAPPSNLAIGYWGDAAKQTAAPRVSDGVFEAAGGLYSSVNDYARYVAYQLAAYPARDALETGPIRRSSLRELHQGQRSHRQPGEREPLVQHTSGKLRLWTGGYGFGWSEIITCNEGRRVQHGGWEPGYSSAVVLLPQHRLGIILLSTTQPVIGISDTFELLRGAGALPPLAEPPASPALIEAQRGVTELLERWDPALAARIFDPGDHHYPWFQTLPEKLAKVAREHGQCQLDGPLHTYSRLHGRFRLRCERGALELDLALGPTDPARVIMVDLTQELPPAEQLSQTVARVAAAIGGTPLAADAFVPGLNPQPALKSLAHAAIEHGTCTVAKSLTGDGHTSGVFALQCSEGQLELALSTDETGQISDLDLHAPRTVGATCWQ